MTQKTAKTVVDVLEWIETHDHHFAEWIGERGAETHFVLKGHGHELHIPAEIRAKTRNLTMLGKAFDTRMFRANRAGRMRLFRAGFRYRAAAHA